MVGDGTQTAGSCKSHPLKWRHHGRQRLVGHGLSQQLWSGIACFVEPWSCRGLLNSYRVKSPLQILAFIYQRLVEWKYTEGWAFACWLWLILDARDSFHDVVISYQKKPPNLNQPASVTAMLCDQGKPWIDTSRAFRELTWWSDRSGLLGHFTLRSFRWKYTWKSGQGPVSWHPCISLALSDTWENCFFKFPF